MRSKTHDKYLILYSNLTGFVSIFDYTIFKLKNIYCHIGSSGGRDLLAGGWFVLDVIERGQKMLVTLNVI